MSNEKLGAEQGRLELERRCNYYFGGYDGGTRCQKLKGHDGAHLWESDAEQLLSSATSQLAEQAYHARGAGALIAPIRALIEYHEKYAKSHVSSQWIYGENMMVVQAYKKVLQMIETLREPGADTEIVGREHCWSRVEDGLPTEYGNYFVIRENADLHDVSVAVTSFHPRGVPPWFDKGFNYLYWIGPIAIPKELPMVGHWTRKRFEERMHETE